MRFNNSNENEIQEKEFVLQALKRHYRGDMQVLYNHFPEFLQSPAVAALLAEMRDLEKKVFAVWEMEGYHEVSGNLTESEDGMEDQNADVEAGAEGPSEPPYAPIEVSPDPPRPEGPRKVILPNGKVQQDYRFDLNSAFPELLVNGSASLIVNGLAATGLALDSANSQLKGMPDNPGYYSLTFKLVQPGTTSINASADLHIIPDPRLLWKELEPEAGQPYLKGHAESAVVSGPQKTLLGASRRGRSHAHTGAFREDDFALHFLADPSGSGSGWYLSAVADGAGSARYSRRGSQLACESAITLLKVADWQGLETELDEAMRAAGGDLSALDTGKISSAAAKVLGKAAAGARQAIVEEAEGLGEETSAFHTTLLLTAARRFDFGWWVGAWWAGDGAIGLLRSGEAVTLMGSPDGGEFAGQTRFLTSKEVWAEGEAAPDRISFAVVDDFTALALMTDGVSDPKFQTDFNLRQLDKWEALWEDLSAEVDFAQGNLKAAGQLMEWLNFWSTGDHDDRTIVILF